MYFMPAAFADSAQTSALKFVECEWKKFQLKLKCNPIFVTRLKISESLQAQALKVEPMAGIEPATDGLRNRCSTTELHWLSAKSSPYFALDRKSMASQFEPQ